MAEPNASDRIAHEAARLYETGRAESIGAAIRLACESLGLDGVRTPSHGRVRQHVQAMSMQALGEKAYRDGVRHTLTVAEELMSALGELDGTAGALLVGRAAKGHVDGPTRLHVRAYTNMAIGEIAGYLVELGYDEPEFDTVNTRAGRLNRLLLVEDGVEVTVTRCLPSMRADAGRNLFTGEAVATATVDEVRRMAGE